MLEREEVAPLASEWAPGKAILLGEHAVVYGVPALAVPVTAVEARAAVWRRDGPFEIRSRVPGRDEELVLSSARAPDQDPLWTAACAAAAHAGLDPARLPDWRIEVSSTVPVRAGLGSSASVAVAIVRAVCAAAGAYASDDEVARLAYRAEEQAHGTPSGIDNTVVAHRRAIRFAAGEAGRIDVAREALFLIADSGEQGSTSELVAAVRHRYDRRGGTYRLWFDRVAALVDQAQAALGRGELVPVGWAMNTNHLILQALRVSTPKLDALVASARAAGALGAKLSGAGGGGVAMALVEEETTDQVAEAMLAAGASSVLRTRLGATETATA